MFVLLSKPLVLRIESMVPWVSLPGARYVSQADRKGTHELELCANGGVCAACGTKIGTWKPSQPERSKRNKVSLLELWSRNWTIRNGFKDFSDEEGENDELQRHGTVKLKEKIAMLQSEKGLIEREARLYREMAEQKQLYDEQVIETLHWVIMKLEAERSADMMRTTV